ncbi:MAG: short-chain fatty acyl-CoA regulator family protein [Pseudomonadota bacterium]
MKATLPTGTRIRERRLAAGLRQSAVAQAAGISASYLNLIEHNRRPIGGALLNRLADVLEVDQAVLSEEHDSGLAEALRAIGAARGLSEDRLAETLDLVRRTPDWARLIADQAEALEAQARTIEALSDRLTHDPSLADAMHELLSAVSVVRSTASILAQTPEIDSNWLGRFHKNLDADSRRLADGAEAVVSYLDQAAEEGDAQLLPSEVVARFLDRHRHAFPALEADGAAAIPDLVAELTDPRARLLATEMLQADAADAARLPRDVVAAAEAPEQLARASGGDLALVLRRLGVVDPGRGLVICDAAGALIRRKPAAGFPLPIMGAGCPLWPLFGALSQPGRAVVAPLETPDGAGWLAHAIAEPVGVARFDRPPSLRATMLITRATATDQAQPIGPGCRVCPRTDCEARREPSVITGAVMGLDMAGGSEDTAP